MNIKELLEEGEAMLVPRETALLDAEVLLAYNLGESREYLIAHSDEEIDNFTADLYREHVKMVGDGMPIAYILGEKEFYGLNFFVDERVLVPRPETEMLVEKVLEYVSKLPRRARVLDIGTGSGNIAISVAKNCEDDELEEVEALDVSEGAVEVAKVNVGQHNVEDKVHVFQSDLLEAVEEGEKFDVIVANLPYIGRKKNRYVTENVEKHEPAEALWGGEDGLELIERMFREILEKNVEFGMIVGEFGFGQRKDLEKILNKYFDQRWEIEKDLEGIDRLFIIK